MTKTITTTLPAHIYELICTLAAAWGVPKNKVIEEAMKLLKKQQLAREIEEGCMERIQEHKDIAAEFHDAQARSLTE